MLARLLVLPLAELLLLIPSKPHTNCAYDKSKPPDPVSAQSEEHTAVAHLGHGSDSKTKITQDADGSRSLTHDARGDFQSEGPPLL